MAKKTVPCKHCNKGKISVKHTLTYEDGRKDVIDTEELCGCCGGFYRSCTACAMTDKERQNLDIVLE